MDSKQKIFLKSNVYSLFSITGILLPLYTRIMLTIITGTYIKRQIYEAFIDFGSIDIIKEDNEPIAYPIANTLPLYPLSILYAINEK